MAPTIVLITGANRGLGRGILELYLNRPNHIVIAGNRNPEHATSKALNDLPKGTGTRLIIVKIDSLIESDPSDAMKKLAKEESIEYLDIVIANAGVSHIWPKVSDLKISDLKAHIEPNVYGVVSLFQATLPFLLKSENPIWATMGSAGCVFETNMMNLSRNTLEIPTITNAAYGPSKVAIHWLTKRIDAEEEKLTALVLDPGWCKTEMGNAAAHGLGLEEAPTEPEDSCRGMVTLLDKVTKQSHGGKFCSWDGKQTPW